MPGSTELNTCRDNSLCKIRYTDAGEMFKCEVWVINTPSRRAVVIATERPDR